MWSYIRKSGRSLVPSRRRFSSSMAWQIAVSDSGVMAVPDGLSGEFKHTSRAPRSAGASSAAVGRK